MDLVLSFSDTQPHDWIPSLVPESFAVPGLPRLLLADYASCLHRCSYACCRWNYFALFWIETTGMGAKPTAQKIFNSGMQIPGFRRNISSIEKVHAALYS